MDNGRRKLVLEFDEMDAPMILHALRIGATTAMMCGHPDAKIRLNKYCEFVKQFIPPAAQLFGEEEWGEIGIAMDGQTEFTVFLAPLTWRETEYWNPKYSEGQIVVRVGRRAWRSNDSNFRQGDERVQLVLDTLNQLAPMDCKGRITEWVPPEKRTSVK